MFEGPVRKKSKLTNPINDVSFTLAKECDWSRAENRQAFPTPLV